MTNKERYTQHLGMCWTCSTAVRDLTGDLCAIGRSLIHQVRQERKNPDAWTTTINFDEFVKLETHAAGIRELNRKGNHTPRSPFIWGFYYDEDGVKREDEIVWHFMCHFDNVSLCGMDDREGDTPWPGHHYAVNSGSRQMVNCPQCVRLLHGEIVR